ncbi:MAG: hypothetical protein OER90_16590 [Gemmatimonadota bacterium]|nr:hypothetical protein [Gemmatimonadota bacterium]
MPLAQFSEDFYAKLGHGIAEEFVNWFNMADHAYRSEFRELFDSNFRMFDTRLDQRTAELRSEFQRETLRLETKLEQRFSEVKADVARLEERMDRRFEAVIQQQRTALAELRAELIKWMFLFWVGTLGTLIALLKFWV